jgi:hypothetical protein
MRVRVAVLIACAALASTCSKYDSGFEPSAALVVSVAPNVPSIPADGFTRVTITAQIDINSNATHRTVIFSTSKGTLFGQKAVEDGAFEVAAGSDGKAVIELRSSKDAGVAIVQAKVGGYSATTSVTFTGVNSDTIVQISSSLTAVPGDGASSALISAQVQEGWLDATRQITVTTTLGTLDGPTATSVTPTADAQGRVSVVLRSPHDKGTALVTASSGGVSRTLTVTFTEAPPERLLVQSDIAFLPASPADKAHLTVTLTRSSGKPTIGTPVIFRATDVNGTAIGAFAGIQPSNASGVATADFSVGTTTYRMPVTIAASVDGTPASGTTQITIVGP